MWVNEALRTSCQVVQTSITLGEWDSAVHKKTGAEALIWPESDTRGIFKISSKKNSLCFRAPPLLENEVLCLTRNPTSISSTPNANHLQEFLILNTVVIFLPIKKGTLEHSPVLLLGLATRIFFLDNSAPALILLTAKTSEEKSPSLRFGRKLVSFIFREHNWVWKSVTHKQHVPLKGQKQSPLFFHYLLIHEKLSVENYI